MNDVDLKQNWCVPASDDDVKRRVFDAIERGDDPRKVVVLHFHANRYGTITRHFGEKCKPPYGDA